MKSFRIVSILLALLLVACLAVSCGSNGQDPSSPSSPSGTSDPASAEDSSVSESESSEEVSRGPLDHLDDLALNGDTITFLVENGSLGYPSVEIMPNEENGAEIAGSVLVRNNLVEEKLGCTIAERRTDNMASELRTAASDTPDFDIACPYMTTGGSDSCPQ